MRVDTRTRRTPPGGGSSGFDEPALLSMMKVPCDPAQVIVNHASFRVRLGATTGRSLCLDETVPLPVVPGSTRRRARPVVWSGRTEPGDREAGRLLQAVRHAGAPGGHLGPGDPRGGAPLEAPVGSTQVLPRIDEATEPLVVGPRSPEAPLPQGVRPAHWAYDLTPEGYGEGPGTGGHRLGPGPGPGSGSRSGAGDGFDSHDGFDSGYDSRYTAGHAAGDEGDEALWSGTRAETDTRRRGESPRQAFYPDRRMNLGAVLLPMRLFLGFVSIYAGMGKLCDPVYFDGGKRGSMVTWLRALHPWAAAGPLRDFALAHPVGSGLSVAFLQIVVGVLTIGGLWQRAAAACGAALSVTLLVTVSWRSVPVYDAPDIIYLAAWSPLLIAGAPVYSVDGRLASEAWRRLGPRAALWDLRRRVLRRGAVLAAVVVGCTLVTGAMLGAAVRSSGTRPQLPAPTEIPTNNLPGSPLPEVSGGPAKGRHKPAHGASKKAEPKPSASVRATPGRHVSGTTGTSGARPGGSTPHIERPTPPPPPDTHWPTPTPTGGGSSTGGGTGGALGGLLGSGLLGMQNPSGGSGGAPMA